MESHIDFNTLLKFEKTLADFYGSPYAVLTDCCTHAIELCLRYQTANNVSCPRHTYLSIPFTFEKLNLNWNFSDNKWKDYYYIDNTNIVDAAVYWKRDGYIKNTLMCLSFQHKKHLSLGRGGAILCETYDDYICFKKASYDGRLLSIPWAEQDIDTIGYHYYMTPELAAIGLDKFSAAIKRSPKSYSWQDYPDLKTFKVFKEKNQG